MAKRWVTVKDGYKMGKRAKPRYDKDVYGKLNTNHNSRFSVSTDSFRTYKVPPASDS